MIKILNNKRLYRKGWSELFISVIFIQMILTVILAHFMSLDGAIWTSVYLYCSLIPFLLGLLGHLGNVFWCIRVYHIFSIPHTLISLLIFMSMLGVMRSLHHSKLVGHTALVFLLWKYRLAPELMTSSYAILFIKCAFGWSASILLSLVSSLLGLGQIFHDSNHLHKFQSNSQNLHLEEMEKVLNHSEKHTKAHYLHSPLHKARAHSKTIFSISDYPDKVQYHHHHHKKDDTVMMEQIRDGVHILHFYDLESGRSSYQSSASNSLDHIPILGSTISTFNSNGNYLNNWQWRQRIQKTPQSLIKYNSNSKVTNADNILASPPKPSQDKSPITLPHDPFERVATLSRRTSPFRFTDSKTRELQADLNKDNTPLFDASSELLLQITPPMKEVHDNPPQSQQLEEVDMKTPPRSVQFQHILA